MFGLSEPVSVVLSDVDYSSGIYEDAHMIKELARTYTIVISTNNPRSILEHKLKVFEYANYISHVFSSISDFGNIVKNRHFYEQICSKLKVKPNEVLHVGDNPLYDVSEPSAAGIHAILMDRDGKEGLKSLYDLRSILKVS